MTDIKPVEIVYILDRSGSMTSIKNDAIGGFNSSIEEQKQLKDKANITLVLFDNQYEIPVYRTDLESIELLTENTYVPRGMTALNDAIGRTITEFNRMKSEGKIDKVIFCILTDGEENASSEFSSDDIKTLIKQVESEHSWEFLFLAANQDAFITNGSYGFAGSNVANYAAHSLGTASAFKGMSDKVRSYRGFVSSGLTGDDLLNATRSTNLSDDVVSE